MITVVAPVYNEEGTVEELHRRLVAILKKQGEPFEIIFVNDCSTDRSYERLKNLRPLTLISFAKNAGDTAALDAGIEAAKGDIIVVIDADLQDAPEDIPLLLQRLRAGYDVALGWRMVRQERLTRLLFSRLANTLVSVVLGLRVHDSGCGLKAYRACFIKGFRLWGKVQVYLPAVAKARGARICEVPVSHMSRVHGESKIRLTTMLKAGLGLVQIARYRYISAPYRYAPAPYQIRERRESPRIAVIGGGIFGATAALILGEKYAVTLFEKNNHLLGEATFVNQYRHHHGFHYPRSAETIEDIQKSRADFEAFYASIILRVPSYYAVSKTGSGVSPAEYLAVFARHRIPYEADTYPDATLLNRATVGTCIKTSEAVYDYDKLKAFVEEKIRENPRIALRLETPIVGAERQKNGAKLLTGTDSRGTVFQEEFDIVINATYARYNEFCRWLGFPQKELRFRLKEILLIECQAKEKAAITIMDGPFATILPMNAKSNLYTLGDVPLSVHENATDIASASVEDPRWRTVVSRHTEIQERCLQWFPFIKNARYRGSRFVVLPTEMASEKNADRPTELVAHGDGCWSIFSGKIVTAVSVAREILRAVDGQSG